MVFVFMTFMRYYLVENRFTVKKMFLTV